MPRTKLSALATRTPEPPINWLMATALTRPGLVSLAAGFTDPASLPVAEADQLLRSILGNRRSARAALQYGSTVGDPDLRILTGERLFAQDSRLAPPNSAPQVSGYAPDRCLITSGSQQLLYLASECLCDPGDLVLVEAPTYFVFLGILQSHGLRCRGVRMDADGLDPDHLEQQLERLRRQGQLHRLKLLYLVSYFQNPTGTTTSLARKRQALELLRRYERHAGHRLFLVEDAAYRELRFAGEDTASSLVLPGAKDRVLYAGTYSKPFATGARVGFAFVPPALRPSLLRIKANHDFGTSNLLQQLLGRALKSGAYERHVASLRQRYAAKARVMERALQQHFPPEASWDSPRGGLYFWVRLPRHIRTGLRSTFFQRALQENVLYVPGALCYGTSPAQRAPDTEMRLSFGGADPDAIRTGIERLAGVLHRSLRPRNPLRPAPGSASKGPPANGYTRRTAFSPPNGLGTRTVHSGSSRHSPSTRKR